MTCIEWVLGTLFECRHVPKGKDMQWIRRFPSLRCLAPPESYMGYWEKIRNRKSEQSKHTNNMNMSFPSKDMWLLSSLNTKHLGSLFDVIIYLSFPLLIWLSFDVSSLSPFDINFQEGSSGVWVKIGLVLESHSKVAGKNKVLVEDKNHRVELEQNVQDANDKVSPQHLKSVTPSCCLRWHRGDSVWPKETNRCVRVHYRDKALVTSAH